MTELTEATIRMAVIINAKYISSFPLYLIRLLKEYIIIVITDTIKNKRLRKLPVLVNRNWVSDRSWFLYLIKKRKKRSSTNNVITTIETHLLFFLNIIVQYILLCIASGESGSTIDLRKKFLFFFSIRHVQI